MIVKYIYKTLHNSRFWDIKVPKEFEDNPPKPEKLIKKTLDFCRDAELPYILVDANMNILDGYCSYLIAKQVGIIDFAKIKQVRVKIYGKG